MKRVHPEPGWPESWRYSYPYDIEEVYGPVTNPGYAYAYFNRRDVAVRLLVEVLKPGGRILDIAAAQGNFSLLLAEMGFRVTWNDLRSDLEGYVRLKHEKGEIQFAPGNVFDLRFEEPFDAILITEIIEHVAHPDEFLARCAQLVRPGGVVVMTTPNGAYFRNRLPKFSECADPSRYEGVQFKPNADGHIFLLHPGEMDSLAARAGLRVDRLEVFTNPLTNGHLKLDQVLNWLPARVVRWVEGATGRLPMGLRRRVCIQLAARFIRPVIP